jgi:hypothetical protein
MNQKSQINLYFGMEGVVEYIVYVNYQGETWQGDGWASLFPHRAISNYMNSGLCKNMKYGILLGLVISSIKQG